ncbi:MAG: DUF1549 domain-containing protein [Verrucomicrobiota bacterium]
MRIPLHILGLIAISAFNAQAADFEKDLFPILEAHCIKCHGGAKQEGGLDLRNLDTLGKGGESGPVFVAGNPDESLLLQVVRPGSDPHMPPKKQLSEGEMNVIANWIANHSSVAANEDTKPLFPAGVEPRLAIDTLIQKSWIESDVKPAPTIDDATFVRRIYLDLLGRIPTLEERRQFLQRTNSRKREQLVDQLLSSPAHAEHLAEIFNVVLLGREDEKEKKRGDREKHLIPYLKWAFETNRPWNEVGRDLIVARPTDRQQRGASWFLYEQRDDADKMAVATSAALFGTQVGCAQCHDHPVAPEIEQQHYWGLVSFFNRSKNVNTKDGPQVAERAAGGYGKFANLEGDSQETRLIFLTDTVVDEPGGKREKEAAEHYRIAPPSDWINPPKPEKKGEKPKLTIKVDRAPAPKFSRREQLAKIGIEENPAFARAFVNRAWALLIGRGFVHPVDKMDSAHPPSHPDLLDWLAEDFAANGYNVRRLFRAILTSRVYALSARHSAERRPTPDTFAYALDKPLSAEALSRSMLVALGSDANPAAFRRDFVKVYPDLFAEVFSPTVQQAMFTTNGDLVDRMIRQNGQQLTDRLHKIENSEEIVKQIFQTVLGRVPDVEETNRAVSYLDSRPDRRQGAIRQLLWSLFAGAEFRINH